MATKWEITGYKVTATVKNSPNVVPVAICATRLFTIAMTTMRVWQKEGFNVELETVTGTEPVEIKGGDNVENA